MTKDKTTNEHIDECAKRVLIAAVKIAEKHHCCLRCVLDQLHKRSEQAKEAGVLNHIGDEDPVDIAILIIGGPLH